jgi:nicotinamide-nucleotide amidase
MTRETHLQNSVALLATGDEIIDGDILNTNTQEIAQQLLSQGIQVGMHLTVGDNLSAIRLAISFLLQHHRGLIITGGLGPTTDDLTRYALAEALNRELIFDEPTWERIVNRLTQLGYGTPPENNRQQALFPENAVIIPNSKGTASGCILKENEHFIFMLPGPPFECFPMMEKVVLPALKIADFQQVQYHAKWLLFNVSEGTIAEEMEELTKHFDDCTTGYRVCYPYLEIKLNSSNQEHFNDLVPTIEKAFSPYMIEDGKQTASELLKKKLLTLEHPLTIIDTATGGSLEATLKTPDNHTKLNFYSDISPVKTSGIIVRIQGLKDFWEQHQVHHTVLEITFTNENVITPAKFTIPFRSNRVKLYAVEFISQKIFQYLA